jgi:membrane protein implicated in regulation of membrane protease activity
MDTDYEYASIKAEPDRACSKTHPTKGGRSMALVPQVRVLRNVLGLGVLCALAVWLGRDHLWEHAPGVSLGAVAGAVGGWLRWRHLSRRIARRDRRYERNKIFVHYLSLLDVVLAVVAYNPFVALLLGVVLLAGVVGTSVFTPMWLVYVGSSGLAGLGVLTGALLRYERSHGPVYYQYDNEGWSGAEGLVYQRARVVQPLAPAGKVMIQGVVWNAVSLSGEHIEMGAQVEVITTERLTLSVDRLPLLEEK